LACTHYPVLQQQIENLVGPSIQVVPQGPIVAEKLESYLIGHPEIEARLSKNSAVAYFTSEATKVFDERATSFLGEQVNALHHSF
jgi:glutamate racemase